MSDLDDDILSTTNAANVAFMNGDFSGYDKLYTKAADLSVFGPFGGAAAVGAQTLRSVGPAIAKQFKSGTSVIEPVCSYRSGDLFVSVHIERQSVVFVGREAPQDWTLRVTQVYRREDGAWRVVHRHVDPMTERRTLEQALAIAGGPA
jgi:ketosteroid isomerase-like protein